MIWLVGLYLMVTGVMYLRNGKHVKIHKGVVVCETEAPSINIALTVLLDLINGVLFVYLFTKPLKSILNDAADSRRNEAATHGFTHFTQLSDGGTSQVVTLNDDAADRQHKHSNYISKEAPIRRTAFKITLLCWVAMLSTLISLAILGVLNNPVPIALDLIVNALCLMFMTTWFDNYFARSCACPLWCVAHSNCLQSCCGIRSDDEYHIQFTVSELIAFGKDNP